MPATQMPQLIFALSVAREMAERELHAEMLVILIDEALKEAKEEALRHGILVDIEEETELHSPRRQTEWPRPRLFQAPAGLSTGEGLGEAPRSISTGLQISSDGRNWCLKVCFVVCSCLKNFVANVDSSPHRKARTR